MDYKLEGSTSKKWLGLYFECCTVYGRAYISKDGTEYQGLCPRCRRTITFQTGPSGTKQRFFKVG